MQKRAIAKSLRWLRTETRTTGGIDKWNLYDRGEGTEEISVQYGMTREEIAELLLPERERLLDELFKEIEKQHKIEINP